MTLRDRALKRVEFARRLGCKPVRWIADAETAAKVDDGTGQLAGVPIEEGETRWGLQLVLSSF